MTVEASLTLSELVSRFELRRRAPTPVFAAGVRLARQTAVRFEAFNDYDVQASVEDDPPATVELEATAAGQIHGHCSCAEAIDPCKHQVAVAHAIWTRARRPVR